jgi:hypothetical protein
VKKELLEVLEEMILQQKGKLLECGSAFIPNLTTDDLLQPNDYQELEQNPHFRYEEGILAGLQMAQTALQTVRLSSSKTSLN